jgi:CheY-like chemotaxis protein
MMPNADDLNAPHAGVVEARRRALVVLDRVMTIDRVGDPNFAALLQCQAKAREIRAAVLLDLARPAAENEAAIMESTLAFSALLTLIETREHLRNEQLVMLEDQVTRAFGRTLAVAATLGELVVGARAPTRTPERPAGPPKAPDATVRPVVTPRAQPAAPSAPTPSQSGVVGSASYASTVPGTSDAPRARADASPPFLRSSAASPSSGRGSLLRTKRVLIVGDPAEIGALSTFFGQFKHGRVYEVLAASNPAQAVSALGQGRLDLIVLDPQIQGLDGLLLLKQIRAADQTLPVIVVTGKQETREAGEVLKVGVFAYVPKPCDFTQLEHLVALALSDVVKPGSA